MPSQRRFSAREACALPPEHRTEEQVEDILDFVKNVKFFQKLSQAHQKALCRRMTIESFQRDQYIFHVGDVGDKFYIIVSGSVSVQVPRYSLHGERTLEVAMHLKKGAGFGELALQKAGEARSAAIQAVERTEVLVTTREDYDMFAGQRHMQFIQTRVNFLRQCPHIEDALLSNELSLQDLAAMADCLVEDTHSGKQMVFKQGDPVENIIFVRSGQLAMLRTVEPTACRTQSPSSEMERKALQNRGGSKDDKRHLISTNLSRAMCLIRARERATVLANLVSNDDRAALLAAAADADEAANSSSMLATSVPNQASAPSGASPRQLARPSPLRTHERGEESKSQSQSPKKAGKAAENSGGLKGLSKTTRVAVQTLTAVDAFGDAHPSVVGKRSQTPDRSAQQASRKSRLAADAPAAKQVWGSNDSHAVANEEAPTSNSTRAATASSWRSRDEGNRPKVLRVGAIGAFQYFGDYQVATGDAYPVSLISDPVVELYLISKNDILRRLPKRLVSSLFAFREDSLPTDLQLMQMQRQTDRWSNFRRTMHSEAMSDRSRWTGRDLRVSSSRARVDVNANLEFLGINPNSETARMITMPSPRKGQGILRPKDEELYSQAPARFLRNLEVMRRDPGLRSALVRDGRMRKHRDGEDDLDEEADASCFYFDLHWSRLRRDPIELALSEDIEEESSVMLTQSNPPRLGSSRGGPRQPRATPRGGVPVSARTSKELSSGSRDF